MRFVNPDTNEELLIDFSFELADMLAEASLGDCFHSKTEIRARTVQGGSVQIKYQCLDCGSTVGNPLPKARYPSARVFDEALLKSKNSESERSRWEVARSYILRRESSNLDFQIKYKTYLLSPEWKKLRTLVFKRNAGICEGCMQSRATEVHHLTYRHFGAEFLFELVGLCHPCHARLHQHYDEDNSDTRPCRGCRFQGDGTTCPIFDVTEIIALAESQFCGPDRAGFQALK